MAKTPTRWAGGNSAARQWTAAAKPQNAWAQKVAAPAGVFTKMARANSKWNKPAGGSQAHLYNMSGVIYNQGGVTYNGLVPGSGGMNVPTKWAAA